MMENWKPVPGYEGLYDVSNLGNVRRDGFVLNPYITKKGKGYFEVTLSRKSKNDARTVHSLILEAFVGPRPLGFDICHLDDDRFNNKLENLKYDTHQENIKMRNERGRSAVGKNNGRSKLKEDDILKIVELKKTHTYEQLSNMYGVSGTSLWQIFAGKSWTHITGIKKNLYKESA